ncbi:TetR/AcrR family transcriptional regulator [Microbacterium rhizomatis]|uniref:TetR/AcrR family transcriptional regulator n=1 Tax=Microbacterium rhizomatis TaxID=1631477 RepID=A0A5J5J566_9MICO|nr:TetR/AcrR family transcriptional regulator [Microbacterium rhizomatis]KAA9111182.1 TetR/AcrR family transcriptional regulator [Microbacterium rhizomatis]
MVTGPPSESSTGDAVGADVVTGTEAVILDAALAEVLAHGIRRTTISDIARRCGVSRQTLYRYWPDAQSVFAALVTRELARVVPVGSAPLALEVTVSLAGLVEPLVEAADRVRRMPLIARLRQTDPELLARYVLDRLGTSQYAIHDEVRRRLDAAQRAGSIRDGDPARMAAMVLLITQSAVLSAPLVREWLDDPAWAAELGRALEGYLRKEGG